MKALVNLGLLFIVLFLAGWEFFLVTIVTCIVVLVGRYFFKKLYWDKPHRVAERERKYQEELQRIYDEWERECNESSKRCLERLRKYSDLDS